MPPPPLAELTARAQTLTSAGDLAGARRVLANVLDPADASDPRRADPDLALAAALHARILIALGDPHSARVWAAFAQAAEERLHGPHDERTVAAAATHGVVLQRIGHHGRAAQVYRRLVADLSEIDGSDSPQVLAAEADLAVAEHSAGHCTAARRRLVDAWRRHHRKFGDASPAGIKMLTRLGAMERECGREDESRHHLRQAQALCARYLPGDHPLVRQVAALAGGSASGKHTCGRVEQSAGPQDAPTVQTTPFPRRPTVPVPDPGFPPADPFRPPPDNRPTDPNGTVYQQPLYLSDVSRPPGELTGRHARADTLAPMPGQRVPEYGPDGRPEPRGRASSGTIALPPNSERLRPAVGDEPEPPRRRQPFLLAAVLVAGVAAAVAVVVLTLPDASGSVSPTPSATADLATSKPAPSQKATTTPPAEPGAPQNVRLQDSRDSVSLRWTYPQDADRPVLVSGGRAGQQPRVFQQLPAGSDEYVVYGLNSTQNYCFTVAVAYSTNNIATSSQVCTKR